MAKLCRIAVALLAIFLVACSTVEPIDHDQSLNLHGDEGLLGVIVDAADTVHWIRIVPAATTSAKPILIPTAPAGQSLFLFRAKAGNYCFDGFDSDGEHYQETSGAGMCFSVSRGAISYSGHLTPLQLSDREFQFRVIYDPPLFKRMLKAEYPSIAAKFLPSFKPSPPLHSVCNPQQETCTWSELAPDNLSKKVFVKNNMDQTIWITSLLLYGCVNIKQPCGQLRHIDVELKPHSQTALAIVGPKDLNQRYFFNYHFTYDYSPPR